MGRGRREAAGPARHGPQRQVGLALDDQQVDRVAALDLQDERPALELQGGGEEHARRGQLAERVAHGLRVLASPAHLAPGLAQDHELAADAGVLEDEALEGVGPGH